MTHKKKKEGAKRYAPHAAAAALIFVIFLFAAFAAICGVYGKEKEIDAVSSASVKLPDAPSGDFLVLINSDLHRDTLESWKSFFGDEEYDVIFDDINCIAARGDAAGIQFAKRALALLPENQMSLRTEDPTLLASKAEAGYIDVVIMSREMADAMRLKRGGALPNVAFIEICEGGKS